MAKQVYYNGQLIPAKDWDYDNKRPKAKEPKVKKLIEQTHDISEIDELKLDRL